MSLTMNRRLLKLLWAVQRSQRTARGELPQSCQLCAQTPVVPVSSGSFNGVTSAQQEVQLYATQSQVLRHQHLLLQQPQQNSDLRRQRSVQPWQQRVRHSSSQSDKPGSAQQQAGQQAEALAEQSPSNQQQSLSGLKGASLPNPASQRGSEDDNRSKQQDEQDASSTESSSNPANPTNSNSSGHSESSTSADSTNSSSQGSHKRGSEQDMSVTDLLVEWRVRTSEWYSSGLNYVINSHLQMPQLSTWSHLYPRKQTGLLQQLLTSMFFSKGSSALTRILSWQFAGSSQIAIPLLQTAHEETNSTGSIEDFKQNLAAAVTTVLELYSQADWQALRPMVSAGLLESMQAAYESQAETGEAAGLQVQDVSVVIRKLDIVCAHAISKSQLASIDEARSEMQPAESVSSSSSSSGAHSANAMWDVAHVYVVADWNATLKTNVGSDRTSQPKRGHWAFCRGPIQFDKVVPADADLPWFVLTWM